MKENIKKKVMRIYSSRRACNHGRFGGVEVEIVEARLNFKNKVTKIKLSKVEAKEAQEYKPWRRAIKSIEQHIGRKGEMLPSCPHCGKAFRLEQVATGGFKHKSICENEGWAKNDV